MSALQEVPYREGEHYEVSDTGCWEWTGTKLRGYATGWGVRPHRQMYHALVGEIPDGYHLHHVCKNPPCINPAHLEPIEPRAHLKMHRRADSVLTERDVIELRERAAATDETYDSLAERYGIKKSQVENIVSGRKWSDVGGPVGPRTDRRCQRCDVPLVGRRRTARYCSTKCREAATYERRVARWRATALDEEQR